MCHQEVEVVEEKGEEGERSRREGGEGRRRRSNDVEAELENVRRNRFFPGSLLCLSFFGSR